MKTTSTAVLTLVRPVGVARELLLAGVANLVLIACAYIRIDLPFSPVPITGQTFGVLLIGMAVGRMRAVGVVGAYLMEGALGLPVFAGGAAGVQVFFGPTGGYLLAFLPGAWLVGYLADLGWDRKYTLSLAAMTLGTAVIFIGGLSWLAAYLPSEGLLEAGLFPFVPGALVKIGLASLVLPSVWNAIGRNRSAH